MSDSIFSFTVSTPSLGAIEGKGFFNNFYTWIAAHKGQLETDIKKILQDYARDEHREQRGSHYQNQTGQLRSATKAEGTFGEDFKKTIDLYVDLSQAPYGEWIITGKRKGKNGLVTWNGGKGDPFIDETIKAQKHIIERKVLDFFNDATEAFNRR